MFIDTYVTRAKRLLGRMLSTALLTAVACSTPDRVAFDFAANLDLATIHPETRSVDVGLAKLRHHLNRGSEDGETRTDGRTFAWGLWPESTLEFYTFDPRPAAIRFRARPSDPMAGTEPRLEVVINGHDIATISLRPGFNNYRVGLPRRRVRMGRNELVFRYGNRDDEALWAAGSIRRSPAVAWEHVRIGPEFPFGSVRADSESLEIPFHTRVDYFVDVAAGAKLRWEQVLPWGVDSALTGHTLRAEAFYEDSPEPTLIAALTGPDLAAPFQAALDRGGVARVSFLALADPGTPSRASGLRILRPVITAPAGAAPPEPSQVEATHLLQAAREASHQAAGGRARLPGGLEAALRASMPAERPPNILVYLVDTLRADHLGAYGYERPTSPALDAMSKEGVVFDHAMAQSAWTRTSVASILTGLQPRAHAVLGRLDTLSEDAVTLPGLLREQGYETHAVITNANVSAQFGFENGFDSFVFIPDGDTQTPVSAQLSERVNESFFGWLEQREPDRPFFAYLHTDDPHMPYAPREPQLSRFLRDSRLARLTDPRLMADTFEQLPDLSVGDAVTGLLDLYDAEIAHNDVHFGRLLDRLRTMGIYDSTVILFISDHGEEFFDHGSFGHGQTLYSEIIFVPLVIRFPGGWGAGARVDAAVQHVDLLPTILDLVGVPPPTGSGGDSLLPVISSAEQGARDERFAPRRLLAHLALGGNHIDSLLTDERHLVESYPAMPTVDRPTQMFWWRTDPTEQIDLSAQSPVSTGYLQLVLRAMGSSQHQLLDSEEAVIDAELADRLRALGYLQ